MTSTCLPCPSYVPSSTAYLLWGHLLPLCPQTTAQLTQARGLFALDLRELGDGVGPVAVGEDDAELLADDLVLWERKQSSHGWALHGLIQAVSRNVCPQVRGAHKLLAGSKRTPPPPSHQTSYTRFAQQARDVLAVFVCCLLLVCSLVNA